MLVLCHHISKLEKTDGIKTNKKRSVALKTISDFVDVLSLF
ncbi:hypothetical protein AO366_0568 [Moraxella catarrhalis]|nr:hypothetical protein AO366_0568 [Moraxella catarrhalis]